MLLFIMTDVKKLGVQAAIPAAGSLRGLARALGISPAAVCRWKHVPADRVLKVEQITGVPRSVLRSDLYPVDRER